LTTFGSALPRALRLQGLMDAHHARLPHWYLAFLGCDPRHQGRGYGGAAVRARLAQCDAAGLPAALETATESNLPIYTALGFRITDSFKLADGPQFWAMWRDPA
ncbi:MAG: GNAT family N-acetyltransferase, partial [Polymorphobacter sp.]